MQPKSPFKIYQEFLSPLQCENIIDALSLTYPDEDQDGNFIPWTTLRNDLSEEQIFDKIRNSNIISELEQYYGFNYRGSKEMLFEWYPAGTEGTFVCENSKRVNDKWARVLDRDISCMLFLTDYHDKGDFDNEWECYGGKLEFPQHQFGFNPQRGTLICYPSGPHFINITAPVMAGDLVQVRWHIAAQKPYLYDPKQFPGDYTNWFADVV